MTEPEVLRHYLHLSQETLGMMGVSLFGTCTMKHNAPVNEAIMARPEVADVHPCPARGHRAGYAGTHARLQQDSLRAYPAWTSSSSSPEVAPTQHTPMPA